jgi:aryl-alcohol dehydrogenase-like predicted oxidoreductase
MSLALIPVRAMPAATARYGTRFPTAAKGHFRDASGQLTVSSIGIGTYLGEPDPATDRAYTASVIAAAEGGINFIDTAINYRLQRSERSIGAALRALVEKGFSREEFVICTKAGFLTPDSDMPDDPNAYFVSEYFQPGIFRAEEIAAGCHCMAPKFLHNQLERSRKNLGLECIDVFYLHNPETQLGEVSAQGFARRIKEAFEFLESAVEEGKIGAYGLATWNGFREEPRARGYLSLEAMVGIAREVAGENHHFRFVQLPLNLAMPDALTKANQVAQGKTVAMVQAARMFGITLVASASLLQGKLLYQLPAQVAQTFGLSTDAERALQFVRSVPGLTTGLVGMSSPGHVIANLRLVPIEPAPRDQFLKLFGHTS